MCKYYAILYKGFESPRVLVWQEVVWNQSPSPPWISQDDCTDFNSFSGKTENIKIEKHWPIAKIY